MGPDEIVDFGVGLDDRSVFFVFGVENLWVLEVFNEAVKALQTGVGENADLDYSK